MSEEKFILYTMESVDAWSGIMTSPYSTNNVELTSRHITGVAAIEFDKAVASGRFGSCLYRSVEFDLHRWNPEDRVCWAIYPPSVTAFNYSFLRLGTSADHYAEWRFPVISITVGRFTLCNAKLGDCYVTGNGWTPRAVTYMAVGIYGTSILGVNDVAIDEIYLRKSRFTQT